MDFVITSLAQYLTLTGNLPKIDTAGQRSVKIGFLAPLTGPVESWGKPGLNGCEIWVDWLNDAGGILIGGQRHRVELIAYDCGDDPDLARVGAEKLVNIDGVSLLMTLGGATLQAIQPFLTERKVLTSTLLPSDLSPDTPYLIAPSEVHPVYNVTGIDFLCKTYAPKSVALCTQTDAMGLPSLATYRAGFKAQNVSIVAEVQYDPAVRDGAAIVAQMMEKKPDVLCWCTSYTPMVHSLTKAAYDAGYTGKILSCTADGYDLMISDTSVQFLEGFTFQFPDFDDPALRTKAFFFNQPKKFFDEYNRRFPGRWSAVSWEYVAILDIWHAGVERASSVVSTSVLAAMKQQGEATHAFGEADWWGRDLFGVSNALVGDWPVVQIQKGRAVIVEFGSVRDWLDQHEPLLQSEMEALGQMWFQRLDKSASTAQLS
jgi:branched-chain amino acid transport system substrate-binding protein